MDESPHQPADPVAVATVALLRAAGAGEIVHAGGRSLLEHLIGSYTIVRRWEQPDWLAHAALIHSVYGTDVFHPRLLRDERRQELIAAAGPRAERLARLFSATPRGLLFAGTHRWVRDLPLSAADPELPPPRREELDALVLLHMANLAEQAASGDGSPGRWLGRVRDLAELLLDSEELTPPLFTARLLAFTDADEANARRTYLEALAGDAPDPGALALSAALCPVIAEPCAWLSASTGAAGEREASRSWAAEARTRLRALGTPWDKRLSFERWLAVIGRLEARAAPPAETMADVAGDPRRLFGAVVGERRSGPPAPAAPADPAPAEAPALSPPPDRAGARLRFERFLDRLAIDGPDAGRIYPDLDGRPWHDPAQFPLVAYLESNFAVIRREILGLDAARFQAEAEPIDRTGEWDVVFLYERGRRHDAACEACPVTARGIAAPSVIRTHAGLSYVSRLRPGTRIGAHRGPTNLRLRCHLGIAVPEGDCAIRVGEETRRWQEGRCLVFDDYFEHEAWNLTDQPRIVLIVDLWHPGLSAVEVRRLEALHGYTHRHAQRLNRYWSANQQAARDADREWPA